MSEYRNYAEYLRHPKFLRVRAAVMRRSGGVCENAYADRCTNTAIDVHHVRYCKWGEFDPPENLIAVCRKCHEGLHTCERCGGWLKAEAIKANRSTCFSCFSEDHAT